LPSALNNADVSDPVIFIVDSQSVKPVEIDSSTNFDSDKARYPLYPWEKLVDPDTQEIYYEHIEVR
jgi:hypothetical protein